MIHTRGLSRTFRVKKETVEAVRGVDIDVDPGELVALLGPNGAGKSTTLRMLTTLLRPTGGTAEVAGRDIVSDPAEVRRHIGYIGQGNSAGHAQRVGDELISQGRFYGLSRAEARRRAQEVMQVFALESMAKRTGDALSGGQRRRLDIGMGMVHRPELLFLDEPSTGLDPQNRANLSAEIARLRRDFAVTILVTTHYLDEADQLADRVLIIDQGNVIADGAPARLKSELAGDRITVTVGDEDDAARAATTASRIDSAREVAVDGMQVSMSVGDAESLLPEYLRQLDSDGVKVAGARNFVPTLDDVFLALTGRSLREADA